MNFRKIVLALALGGIIIACENDDNNDPVMAQGDFENGILVTNEGPFNNGTGTVSFISEALDTVGNAIYNSVNGSDLGNIVQSIGFSGNKAYIVANVSNTITVVDRYTFEELALIDTGLDNPRYFVAVNGTGYVTNWGDGMDETDDFIALVDLESNTITGSIPVPFGPEDILASGSTVYVAHQGAFGFNDKISVIDTDTDAVSDTITVGAVPNSMQLDAAGDLWVLSAGKPNFSGEETAGRLQKIAVQTATVTTTFDFEVTEHPNHLSLDGSTLYYSLDGNVFGLDTDATALPAESDFSGLSIYGMTTNRGRLYTTDAKDFASNGDLNIFSLDTKSEIGSFEVGIIPGGVYFNE